MARNPMSAGSVAPKQRDAKQEGPERPGGVVGCAQHASARGGELACLGDKPDGGVWFELDAVDGRVDAQGGTARARGHQDSFVAPLAPIGDRTLEDRGIGKAQIGGFDVDLVPRTDRSTGGIARRHADPDEVVAGRHQ